MNTRRAADGSYQPLKIATPADFSAGLPAMMVADRTATLKDPAEIELIWWLQYQSHQPGGLPRMAAELLEKYSDRIGTETMLALAKDPSGEYTADEVRKIRAELALGYAGDFPLKGETETHILRLRRDLFAARLMEQTKAYDRLAIERAKLDADFAGAIRGIDEDEWRRERERQRELEEADTHPMTYPVNELKSFCHLAALNGLSGYRSDFDNTRSLQHELLYLCIDPNWNFSDGAPWYFPHLAKTLREYQAELRAKTVCVQTSVVQAVTKAVDFVAEMGGLSLITGPSNVGAKFAARHYCMTNPGRARLIECPATNDKDTFVHEVRKALDGFASPKNNREESRINDFLRRGELTLVLVSAENIFPMMNQPKATPKRLAWLMDQTEKGMPACLIAGPEFFVQKQSRENAGWNHPELKNKIDQVDQLPDKLTVPEMAAIAKCVLPQASDKDCKHIACGAVGKGRYLATLKAITKRAAFLAKRAGRTHPNADDVDTAIICVDRSETNLKLALESNELPKHGAAAKQDHEPLSSTITAAPAACRSTRLQTPAGDQSPAETFSRRQQTTGDLVTD